MARLLTLLPERIAREQRHVLQAAEDERQRRRRAWVAIADAALWLGSAYALLWLSFWVSDPDWGYVAFWAGLALGNFGPAMTGFRFWAQSGS